MATAYGLEPAPGVTSIPTMPDRPDIMCDPETNTLPSASPHIYSPPPNPIFTFPAQPTSPSSAPSSFSRATGRRPMSAIETSNHSYKLSTDKVDRPTRGAALPDFSFNPGASLPPDPNEPLSSPDSASLSPRITPSAARPVGHGHRRGGSEFVGGRIREGNSIAVMTGSPTKENGFPAQSLQPPPRRGHRRGISGAVSTNELPLLPLPQYSFPMKGSSAPNSPTHFERLEQPPPVPQLPIDDRPKPEVPEPVIDAQPPTELLPEETPSVPDSPKRSKPGPRARVGFSDTLEFIPRPLSLVSTDTSSTITAKPGHGVSESISSVVSTSSPPTGPENMAPMSRTVSRDTVDSRPSTAGAILERIPSSATGGLNSSPRRRNSIPALLDIAEISKVDEPAPSPTRASKRWTFFDLRTLGSSSSPTKARPQSAGSCDSATRVVSTGSSSDQGSDSADEAADPAKTDKHTGGHKKGKKRRTKMKGWAGSILGQRKPKPQAPKGQPRPPTPPASVVPPDDEDDEDEYHSEFSPTTTPTLTVTESPDLGPATSPESSPRPAEDSSFSMIDLDAALGPFNTPLPHNPEWEAAQRAAGNNGKRRMHSAQGMRGFTGPGMHYHRRAESAPDLPPFEAGRYSIHRFGSNSTMADVFEEEEEEEDDSARSKREPSSQASEISQESDGETTPPAKAPAETVADIKEQAVRRKSSGLSDKDHCSMRSLHAERSRTSLHESVIAEEPPSMRFRNALQARPASAGSPLSSRKASWSAEPSPVDMTSPVMANMPISPNSISHASTFPSPSPRSPISADAQRLSTAPSSVNEDSSFRSLLMGEPGPEVRLSVDYDIPSLTSSNSTTTRDSAYTPFARMSQPTLREPRPLSVSSAQYNRRRSSLVSLSRLISSSHGEKSKLSMEVKLDSEAEAKKSKDSKAKRLGRFVQFWKPSKDHSTA